MAKIVFFGGHRNKYALDYLFKRKSLECSEGFYMYHWNNLMMYVDGAKI